MAMAEMQFISSVASDTLDGPILQVNRSPSEESSIPMMFDSRLKRGDGEHRSIDLDGLPSRSQRRAMRGSLVPGRNAVK